MSGQPFANGRRPRRYSSAKKEMRRNKSVEKRQECLGFQDDGPEPGVHGFVFGNTVQSTKGSVDKILEAQMKAIDELNATMAKLRPQLGKQIGMLQTGQTLTNHGLVAILLVRAMTLANGVPETLKRLGTELIARVDNFEEAKVQIDEYEACVDEQCERQFSIQRVTSA